MKRIVYIGATDDQVNWGSCADPRPVLSIGNIYEIDHEEIHTWHTEYFLRGYEGGFNSVCFEEL